MCARVYVLCVMHWCAAVCMCVCTHTCTQLSHTHRQTTYKIIDVICGFIWFMRMCMHVDVSMYGVVVGGEYLDIDM